MRVCCTDHDRWLEDAPFRGAALAAMVTLFGMGLYLAGFETSGKWITAPLAVAVMGSDIPADRIPDWAFIAGTLLYALPGAAAGIALRALHRSFCHRRDGTGS